MQARSGIISLILNYALLTLEPKLMSVKHILSLTEIINMGSLVISVEEKADELGCKIIQQDIEILDQS